MSGAYDGLRLATRAEVITISTTKENIMTDNTTLESLATPLVAVSSVDLNARMKTVFAADAVKGKEGFAASLMADPEFDGLSAEAIVKLVAAHQAPAANADDDAEQGKRMLAEIEKNPNPDLAASGGEQKTEDHEAGWSKATAKINKRNGF